MTKVKVSESTLCELEAIVRHGKLIMEGRIPGTLSLYRMAKEILGVVEAETAEDIFPDYTVKADRIGGVELLGSRPATELELLASTVKELAARVAKLESIKTPQQCYSEQKEQEKFLELQRAAQLG